MGPVEPSRREPSLLEIADALLLYDEPVLNHRFISFVERAPSSELRNELKEIPRAIARNELDVRRGAVIWDQSRTPLPLEFIEKGERILLEAFLGLVEAQTRLISFMARSAPEDEARNLFNRAAAGQREIARTLRNVIPRIGRETRAPRKDLRSVQEEEHPGSLRGQVEAAIHAARRSRRPPRILLVSHSGLRHLRDEGAFPAGESEILEVPVIVDWGWEAPAFALQTFSSTPLAEILHDGELDPPPPTPP